jgi:hypothetical protein
MKAATKLILFIALAANIGCSESTSSSKNNSPSTTTNPITQTPEPQNLGPTGSADPVDPGGVGAVDPVEYYPDEDPDNTPALPGTPTNKCGVLYKQANNPAVFFQEGGQLFTLREFSYDSVVFLRNIRFQNDSFSVCIDGYLNNNNLFINTTTSVAAVANPSKLFQNNEYPHEYCGQIVYLRSFSGTTNLNLQVGNRYHEVRPQMGVIVPGGIPSISSTITTTNSVEACVYSNKASFTNYALSSKPQIEAQAFDLGALNP